MKKLLLLTVVFVLFSCSGGTEIEGKWKLAGCFNDSCSCYIYISDNKIKNGCGLKFPNYFECKYELIDGKKIRAYNCSGKSASGKDGIWTVKNRDGVGDVLFSPGNVTFNRR